MDALSNAFAAVDRSHAHACKAVANVGPMLTAGLPNLGLQWSSLSKAKEQYAHAFTGWSFVAIRAIASRIAGQPVCVGRLAKAPKTGRKMAAGFVDPLGSHPFLDVVAAPNPVMVQWSLVFSTVASLLATGRAAWWLPETQGGLQLWPLPTTWLEPADPFRSAWKLRPFGGIQSYDIAGEDICSFLLPDPSNPLESISPLQSQALAISTDEEIQASQFRAFVNGVHPGLMIRVGKLPGMAGQPGERPVLTPEQRIEITDAVLKLYGGTAKRNSPLIVDGMIEGVDKLTSTPDEMDFLDSGKQTKSRILQAFGVNPVVAGELEGANRASSAVAGQHFADSTCNPLIELLSQSLTRFVAARFAQPGEKLVAWIECCRANDPEQTLAEWKAGMAAGHVTQNEFRREILGLPEVPGGDVFRDALGNPINEAQSDEGE
jgi:phage portal protein BeeE